MNKKFQCLLVVCDFHCDGLAPARACEMPGLPKKEVGAVALISVAAVAAGCYLVFKVSVKLGWSAV